MFETNLDAMYAWLGIAVVSVAAAGVAATFPSSPPPDADGVAHTVDSVAVGEYPATAEHGLAAERIRLAPGSVSLDDGRGIARSDLDAPRVTPVTRSGGGSEDGERLRRVLKGAPPKAVFDDPDAFAAAAERARTTAPSWERAPDRLTARQVHYGTVRVTLVG